MFKAAILVLVLATTLATAAAAPSARIASEVLQTLRTQPTVDVIIDFETKTTSILTTINTQSFESRGAKATSLAAGLQGFTTKSQKIVQEFLTSQGKTFKSFWISNKIFVKAADFQLVQALSLIQGVEAIVSNHIEIAPRETGTPVESSKDIQWGVEMVDAPQAWELGFTGRGVVVGILDTGVRGTHETLRDNFRPIRGWLDVVDGRPLPHDSGEHGTHVMGSIVGRNGIGVAPEATWMACGASLTGFDEYLACGQFFLCPTHPDGSDPNCYYAPHILSHSWGKYMGTEHDFMDDIIRAWHAAGIITVWANGNEGRFCATARYPPSADLPLIAVGASDASDQLAYFSSRGPGAFSGANRIRPDITAPGVDIVSAGSYADNTLLIMSGTSMAAPHVAGVIALLMTNATELPFDDVTRLIFDSARHTIPATGGNCGGIPETEYPNNAVGHGRITALAGITRLLETRKT